MKVPLNTVGTSRHPGPLRVPLLMVMLSLSACGGGGDVVQEHSFETITEDGVPVAVSRGAPKYDGELFQYTLIQTLREDESVEESLLNGPGGFFQDEEGNSYVADTGNHRIAVFDAQGRFSHAIGREGSGPGEFRAFRIEDVRGGVVSAYDMSNRKVIRFTGQGVLLDARNVSTDMMQAAVVSGVRTLENGNLWFSYADIDFMNPESIRSIALRVLVLSADGDTVWTMRTPEAHIVQQIEVTIGGMTVPLPSPIPFLASPDIEYLGDGRTLVYSGTIPMLEFFDPAGELVLRIRVELPVQIPSESEKAEIVAEMRKSASEAENDMFRDLYEAQAKAIQFPDQKAPWGEMEVDDYGFIWLAPTSGNSMAGASDAAASFRVLSPEGEHLGTTTVPKGSYRRFRHGRLLLQETDPLTDAPVLKVYEIHPAVAGLVYP